MASTPKPRTGSRLLVVLDRYLVIVSAAIVAGVWIASDLVPFVLSQGTQAALAAFVGYAALKMKTDSRWRELEEAQIEMDALPAEAAIASVAPGHATPQGKAKEGSQ